MGRVFFRDDLKHLAMLAAVAIALFLAATLFAIWRFLMKRYLLVGALALASVALSGCVSLPGGANTDVLGVLKEIATDPSCGHTDRISGNLGGLSGNNLNVFLERTCPPKAAGAAPAPTVAEPPR